MTTLILLLHIRVRARLQVKRYKGSQFCRHPRSTATTTQSRTSTAATTSAMRSLATTTTPRAATTWTSLMVAGRRSRTTWTAIQASWPRSRTRVRPSIPLPSRTRTTRSPSTSPNQPTVSNRLRTISLQERTLAYGRNSGSNNDIKYRKTCKSTPRREKIFQSVPAPGLE